MFDILSETAAIPLSSSSAGKQQCEGQGHIL